MITTLDRLIGRRAGVYFLTEDSLMQLNRLIQTSTLAGLLLSIASVAQALTFEPFTESRFKALQAENKPVLIDVNAKWCSTCKAQGLVLDSYQRQYPSSGITVLKVDFDSQKRWVSHFKAPRQSTFVSFKGKEQVDFSVAETRASEIFKQLDMLRGVAASPTRPASSTPSSTEQPKLGFFERLFQRS